MKYFSKKDEAKVRVAVTAAFPGYCVSFMDDPDDSSVVFVRLYDVAESDIATFKQKLRKILKKGGCTSYADLIPSIVSSKEDIHRLMAERFDDLHTWTYIEPVLSKWQIESNISSLNSGVADVGQTSRFAA